MKATIKDVAAAANVSTATVSRVLSGKNPVREDLKKHVLAAIEQLEYYPNALARSLREQSTLTLGLLIPNISNPFFTSVARGVEDTASEHGYSVILCNADESPRKQDDYLEVLLQKQVDGLVISPAQTNSPRLIQLAKDGFPLVLVDRSVVDLNVPVVRIDGQHAVTELVEYLVGLGHKRIAIISGPTDLVSGQERLKAFKEAAEKLNVEIPGNYVRIGDFRRESGTRNMHELLNLRQPPTAVFVANNLMTLGAMQTIKRLGMSVPQDISLASFDDVSWFTLTDPPVTAIAQPTYDLGVASARAIFELIEGEKNTAPKSMQAQLIIRESCGVSKLYRKGINR